jgi:hypothetical protein
LSWYNHHLLKKKKKTEKEKKNNRERERERERNSWLSKKQHLVFDPKTSPPSFSLSLFHISTPLVFANLGFLLHFQEGKKDWIFLAVVCVDRKKEGSVCVFV